MNNYPWTLFFILLAVGLLATLAIMPYSLAIKPEILVTLKEKLEAKGKHISPLLVVISASLVQGGLLVALAAFVGLLAARSIGLGLPVLQSALAGQPYIDQFLTFLPVSLLLGLVGGAGIVALEHYVFQPRLPAELNQLSARISFWKRVTACFYGGIVEEILLRLFVMGGFTWLIGLVWKSASGGPALGAFWLANVLAAILFGLGHLPTTARVTRLTPLVVARALILNGIAGLMFGYLFITYGLEAAILAHFTMDIMLHLVHPALKPFEVGPLSGSTGLIYIQLKYECEGVALAFIFNF